MMKIHLVMTGGTIGSINRDGVIGTAKDGCRILELYREKYGGDCDFEVSAPLDILSENLTLRHWEALINHILSLELSGIDGMIITHGSDTLSYSSAMLGFCLNHLGIPVVITAANKVPDDPGSNALENFRAAVRVIMETHGGVYTVYRSSTESLGADVFIPTRLQEADRYCDRFTTFGRTIPAIVSRDVIIPMNDAVTLDKMQENHSLNELREIHLEKSVLMVRPYPSMDYSSIIPGKDTGAVLHITYHSSTVSEEAAVLLEKCRTMGIPFYLCSFRCHGAALYETSKAFLDKGAVPLYNISNEAAYAKLLLAVNLCPEKRTEFMNRELYFEFPGGSEN